MTRSADPVERGGADGGPITSGSATTGGRAVTGGGPKITGAVPSEGGGSIGGGRGSTAGGRVFLASATIAFKSRGSGTMGFFQAGVPATIDGGTLSPPVRHMSTPSPNMPTAK